MSALRLCTRVHVVAVLLLLTFSSFPPSIQGSTQPVAAGSEALARYTVEITDAGAVEHEVWVKAVISLSGATDLSVSQEWDVSDRWITVEKCYDAHGAVPFEQVNNRTWRINPRSAGDVTIEYRASANMLNRMTEGTYLAYLSEDCGLVSAKSILLAPSPPVTAAVNFVLPQGWTVITDERWTRLNATSFSVSTGDLDLIALGRWDVYTDTFGDGQMLRVAICGDTKHPKDDYIKNIKACLDYFHERVGRLPQRELNVILADLPLPGDYMSGTPRLAVNQAGRDWGMFEGMLWHYWFLRIVRYDTQLDSDRAWWFGEGVSPFILYPVYEEIGAASEVSNAWGFKYSNLTWKNWYAEYESQIGTKYDVPLTGYPVKGSEGQYNQLIGYFKSSLVLELLNASMVEVTHGEYDVRDVVKNLYEDYTLKGVGYRVEDILSAFNAISGNDYTEFFNAYVYGSERLPILEEGDDYLFDWATLGDKTYRSMPNAEKVRPWTQATVPASETATLLEMRKESRHFTVYFHQQDAKIAALLLLDCEKAYDAVAKLYGDEAKLKIRMFMTYNGTEYAVLGGRPEMIYDEKASAGGVAVEAGDEISWLRPIFNRNTTQMYDVKGPIHELGHAMLRQIYPGVYKNWEQWFNEGMPLSMMAWLDKRWAPASESCSPFIDHEPLQQLQRSLLGVSSSIMPLTQLAKMNYAQFNDTGRLLFQGEGIAFHFYINSRYENGLQRLLTKYDESVPLSVAAERAFGVTYADIESDLWATAGKAALNLDYTEFALSKIRREGVDTSLAQKLLSEEPFLALLVAYAAEARAGAGFERLVFGTIKPDAPVKMDLDTTPLTSLNVSSAQRLDNFIVTVEEVMPAEAPTAAQGEVYCYLRVNSSSESAGPITIAFKVENSWFSDHAANVSSTSMVRHTATGWTLLPTEKIGQDGAYTYFSAVSPGMSVFAITAARNVSKVVPSTTIDGWVSPAAFGTPTTLFLVVDGLHPTVQNSGNDEPFIVVKLVDSKGSVLVEKGYNGKGLTGYGDYNPDKSLAPGSYRMEFWNSNVLVKIIPIIFSTDIVSPTIISFTPTNGSVITSKTVSITASFSDDKGIKTSSVILRVDGNDVTSSATITATTISYESTLGEGAHTAQLTVSDTASNTASSTVSFTVILQQQPQLPSNATTPATGSRSRAADLWPFLSVGFVAVALILIPLIKGKKDGKFTRRKAAAILIAAPILFLFSGLFLANTLVNPAESIPYQLGIALCFAASPTLMLSGIIVYLTAPHEKKKPPAEPPTAHTGEKLVTSLPRWEKQARKIYGTTALLLIGLLVATWSPLMIFIVGLIPYIIFIIYMLRGKRSLVASLFFLLIWYGWFSALSDSISPIHFSQILSEVIKNSPYFGPLGYNVWWMFYSVVMFSGVVMLLLSSLSGVKRIEKVMTRVFTAKTCALILTVPMILMFALPPSFATNPLMRHPSIETVQATDISINKDQTERYFNETSGEWVYSIAVRYNGNLLITNVSLGGKVISPPFDNSRVRITEYDDDVAPNFSNSGVIVIRDKAFVNWVSLVSRNGLGEAIYGIGWF